MRKRAPSLLPVLLMAAAAVQDGAAQRVDRNRMFDLTVDSEGQIFSATVREGEPLLLTLRQTDEYRLVPVLQPGTSNAVTMAVYRGVAGQEGSSRLVERLDARFGATATLRVNPSIRFVVDGMRRAPERAAAGALARPTLAAFRLGAFQESCCVCCGEACACACAVKMYCGTCCMGDRCAVQQTAGSGPAAQERAAERRIALLVGGSSCRQGFPAAAAQLARRSAQAATPGYAGIGRVATR